MARPRKVSGLAPIKETQPVENQQVDVQNQHMEQTITENSNIDQYIGNNSQESTFSEKDAEIAVLNEQTESLKEKIKNLEMENHNLLMKLENMLNERNSLNIDGFKQEIQNQKNENIKLKNQNDDYILKNSELEFEIVKLTETVKNIQSKIDNRLHTYTKPSYSGCGGYVPAKNGYQDWR